MRLQLAKVVPFAAALELDLDRTPVCLACLSVVSGGFRAGDERDARSWRIQFELLVRSRRQLVAAPREWN
jgi:hypothetical protein